MRQNGATILLILGRNSKKGFDFLNDRITRVWLVLLMLDVRSVEWNGRFALDFRSCVKVIDFRNDHSGVSLFTSRFMDRWRLCQNRSNFREDRIDLLLLILLFLGRDGIDLIRR